MNEVDADALERTLASVSIRGRMAYAVASIQPLISALEARSPVTDECLRLLAEFCSFTDLGAWESDALPVIASAVQSNAIATETGMTAIQEAIDAAFEEIGRGNLYGGVVGRSDTTLRGVLQVAKIADEAGAALPDPDPFLASAFTQAHGWGEPWRPGLRFDL